MCAGKENFGFSDWEIDSCAPSQHCTSKILKSQEPNTKTFGYQGYSSVCNSCLTGGFLFATPPDQATLGKTGTTLPAQPLPLPCYHSERSGAITAVVSD